MKSEISDKDLEVKQYSQASVNILTNCYMFVDSFFGKLSVFEPNIILYFPIACISMFYFLYISSFSYA